MLGSKGMRIVRHRFKLFVTLALLLGLFAPASLEAKSKHSRKKRTSKISKSVAATPFSTVVIDAGHGGFDRGGIRQNLIPEKDVALDVALNLREKLREAGLKTVMTRADDRFVTLGRRVAIANAHPEAIFVSIHFNAGLRRSARGVETFYASPSEATLAARIQRNLTRTTPGENRGIKRASFYVLRQTKIRAVLAECGFLTNPWDVALAQRSRYRQDLARQISLAIVEERNSLR